MTNSNKSNNRILPYDEDVAQAFIHNLEYDNCVMYCLPTIKHYLWKHRWTCVTEQNYEDYEQELVIALITAINTYNPIFFNKKTSTMMSIKLITWIWNNYRYKMFDLHRKDKKDKKHIIQLTDDMDWLMDWLIDFEYNLDGLDDFDTDTEIEIELDK